MPLWTVDAHCHLTDPRIFGRADELIRELRDRHHVRGFLLGGVDPEDWSRQMALARRHPGVVWPCLGLHPYYVAATHDEHLDPAFTAWRDLLPAATAAGEMGLDLRQTHLGLGADHQEKWFTRQLDHARAAEKPVVLHIVRAHEPALRVLKSRSPLTGMVHAFNANSSVARSYLDLGLHLSLGAAILRANAEALREAVRIAPLGRLLIESDAPDQPPPGTDHHDSATIWRVAEAIADLKNVSPREVITFTRRNFTELMRVPLERSPS